MIRQQSRFCIHPTLQPPYGEGYSTPQGPHPDVEYEVYDSSGRFPSVFRTFSEAAGFALMDGVPQGIVMNIDVLVYSEAGARFWGGQEAAVQYRRGLESDLIARIEVTGDVTVGRM